VPKLYLIAGCNGCGKTTFMRSPVYLRKIEQFDPDARFAALGSWREVAKELRKILAARTDLVLETTLSGKTVLKHIAQAKKDGYEINIARIATRIALGGHHISDTDVRRRWNTTLANLPTVMAIADSTLILDNSRPQEHSQGAFQDVARIQNFKTQPSDDPPEWAKSALPSIFRHRQR
jgi:predicted ABC-type ATPase